MISEIETFFPIKRVLSTVIFPTREKGKIVLTPMIFLGRLKRTDLYSIFFAINDLVFSYFVFVPQDVVLTILGALITLFQ